MIFGPVIAVAARHISVTAEEHSVLGVSVLAVYEEMAVVHLFDATNAERLCGRPPRNNVLDKVAWPIRKEGWQVCVVPTVFVRKLDIQLDVPAT